MTHASIGGSNGPRHEVDFGDASVRVEVYASDTAIEIFVDADFETLPEERRPFAMINIPLPTVQPSNGRRCSRAPTRRRWMKRGQVSRQQGEEECGPRSWARARPSAAQCLKDELHEFLVHPLRPHFNTAQHHLH